MATSRILVNIQSMLLAVAPLDRPWAPRPSGVIAVADNGQRQSESGGPGKHRSTYREEHQNDCGIDRIENRDIEVTIDVA